MGPSSLWDILGDILTSPAFPYLQRSLRTLAGTGNGQKELRKYSQEWDCWNDPELASRPVRRDQRIVGGHAPWLRYRYSI